MAKTARRKKAGVKAPAAVRAPRAFGRSLSDFPDRNKAEEKLLACARAGEPAEFGDTVPETEDEKKDRTIRAGFVRFLALGGDDDAPVHEQGVQIQGAAIDGALDLDNCTLPANLGLFNCNIAGDVNLQGACLRSLSLQGSRCAGIEGDRLNATGSVFLRGGFTARGAVRLLGAKIGGNLECDGGEFAGADEDGRALHCDGIDVGGGVFLRKCAVKSGAVRLPGAKIGGVLDCSGGTFAGADKDGDALVCDGIDVGGGVFLRNGFTARGAVRLLVATIETVLDCSGGQFAGADKDGNALACDGIAVGGGVYLGNGFTARGAVRLIGAKIGGNLECDGGRFEGADKDGNALACDRIDVGGSVFLREGFVAHGAVRLLGATIGGDVVCADGRFGGTGEDAERKKDAESEDGSVKKRAPVPLALDLSRATVNGTLYLVGKKTRFHGGADLTGSHIRRIADDVNRTTRFRAPDPSPKGGGPAPCFLVLDGLTYDRFGEDTDLSADARLAFLRLQHPFDLGKDFKPQPWMQMVKVLRETGHADAAREIAIAHEEARRAAGVITSRTASLLHRFYGWLVGYGHRPMRLLKITAVVWFVCAIIYENAAQHGWMAPTQSFYFQHARYDSCRPENGGNWTRCETTAPEYTTFNPLTYSLDVLLPLVDLQQQDAWAPIVDMGKAPIDTPWGVTVRVVMWLEILFGWLASLLLAAVVAGLAKRTD